MKIMVSAGEVSGDLHAAALVRELKKLDPSISFFGIGSEKLAAEGVDIRFDLTKHASIGILESLPNLLPVYFTFKKIIRLMKKEKPDLLLLVDSQGVNVPIAGEAKKLGIKTVYYIPPQEWLWGTLKGAKKVAQRIDLIVSIFEKEHTFYKNAGGNSVYFGHPLLDIVKPSLSKEEAKNKFLGKATGLVVSLCPGSRPQEIKSLLPILLKAGEKIKAEIPDVEFLMPVASAKIAEELSGKLGALKIKTIVGKNYDVLAASDLAVCVSGTINLECCLLGVPNIMTYKLSLPTYLIGKYLLRALERIPFFSMPNILLGEKVVPELTMADANPDKIAKEALLILKNPGRQDKMKADFERLKQKLGSFGVLSACAKEILRFALLK
ncbi:MAG: lipid-A-disaccharide synthase [Candidatus Saganbacteria bacterium]|nr:lipid-A-disaccharide synthase [Candidatus Saganbacteria bacterium]